MIKKIVFIAAFSVMSVFIFAASGGKDKKKTTTKKSVGLTTTSKITLGKITLNNAYEFKGNKVVLSVAKKNYTSLTNYTTIQKGNKTLVVASKHTLVKPAITLDNNQTSVNVKLLKIKIG